MTHIDVTLHFNNDGGYIGLPLRWLRLFGQVFRFLSGRIVQLVVVVGGGNVKIGFIDFQGLVGRSENSSIVFRAFHETGISTACFVAR